MAAHQTAGIHSIPVAMIRSGDYNKTVHGSASPADECTEHDRSKLTSCAPATRMAWHSGRTVYPPEYTQEEVRQAVAGMLHAWVPLVPSTMENGCLRVIRGSHLIDVLLLCPKQGSHTLHTRRDPAGYLEIDSENETLQRYINEPGRVVDVQLAPGDVCFFKPGLIHSGYPNSSSGVRWSAEFRLQDAEVPTLRSESGDIARSLKQPKAAIVSGQQWESLPTFHGATALVS